MLEEAAALDVDNRLSFLPANLFVGHLLAGHLESAWELVPAIVPPDRLDEARMIWPEPGPLPVDADFDAWPGLVRTRAMLWQLAGNSEKAISTLEHYLEIRPPFGSFELLWLEIFDPIRDDPRFLELLDQAGLAGRRPIRAAEAAQ